MCHGLLQWHFLYIITCNTNTNFEYFLILSSHENRFVVFFLLLFLMPFSSYPCYNVKCNKKIIKSKALLISLLLFLTKLVVPLMLTTREQHIHINRRAERLHLTSIHLVLIFLFGFIKSFPNSFTDIKLNLSHGITILWYSNICHNKHLIDV